uniref:Uncharacterized protein n=1 Tax=Hyaloperonospora arabidopsidis (strain Emoy2) TaxID=559515 RepID=M4BVI9_HYAAE
MLTLTTVTYDCAAFVIDQISSRALFDLNCIEAEASHVSSPPCDGRASAFDGPCER